MARWEQFEQCPHCGWNIATNEGERGCAWGDCPYLPEELNVFCDWCRFDFATMEGNSPCDDPLTCEHGVVPRAHVENYHRWAAAREALTTPGA
ncbi:MAG TPA: hypothetical protein VEO00_08470 [Actinomycetota bacterium]|nr:hypothetical protein [Actinomycetota bacterium]